MRQVKLKDRKPSLSDRRAAHGMRTPSDEERRENLERNLSEIVGATFVIMCMR